MSNKQSSAYFMDSDVEDQYHHQNVKINPKFKPEIPKICFPSSRNILWNRQPISNPKYLKSSDIVPPLFLTNEAIYDILLGIHTTTSFDRKSSMISSTNLLNSNQSFQLFGNHPPFVFQINSESNNEFHHNTNSANDIQVTIPFNKRTGTDSLNFEEDNTTYVK